MSSLRNLHQKSYKERSGPTWHKGFLQKKKDYVVRAADYHRKQDKIKKLKEKAYFKNRDEFRGQMIEQKVCFELTFLNCEIGAFSLYKRRGKTFSISRYWLRNCSPNCRVKGKII